MFNCNYKFELEDSLICTKYIYKSNKRRQDKVIAVMIPILLLCVLAMLIVDIVRGKGYVWDIILLVALVVLQVLYLLLPVFMLNSQKKLFAKQELGKMDEMRISIDNNVVTVCMIKDNNEVAKNVLSLKRMTSYIEDENRLILVFNEIEFVCIRKNKLQEDISRLRHDLEKIMKASGQKNKQR